MKYFGTDLIQAGHYIWDISSGFRYRGLKMDEIPFNPYGLTKNLSNGDVAFYQGGGVTAIGIAGSCTDNRVGTTSTFWKEGKHSFEDMKAMIISNTVSRSIIEKMPFKINWP